MKKLNLLDFRKPLKKVCKKEKGRWAGNGILGTSVFYFSLDFKSTLEMRFAWWVPKEIK
jgi:hypothetical protein